MGRSDDKTRRLLLRGPLLSVSRAFAGASALVLTGLAAVLVKNGVLHRPVDILAATLATFLVTLGIFGFWFAARGARSESLNGMHFALLGGMIVGGVGFVAGYFGPILLTPESNQGPLLGIFFTGPLGFVLGVVAGAIVHTVSRRRRAAGAEERV